MIKFSHLPTCKPVTFFSKTCITKDHLTLSVWLLGATSPSSQKAQFTHSFPSFWNLPYLFIYSSFPSELKNTSFDPSKQNKKYHFLI